MTIHEGGIKKKMKIDKKGLLIPLEQLNEFGYKEGDEFSFSRESGGSGEFIRLMKKKKEVRK